MSDAQAPDSAVEMAAVDVGAETTETFGLLGDETRLAVLLALWEHYDPHADDNTVSFSTLFDAVDYENPGSFSYHLEQLRGVFIEQRAKRAGYELRMPGLKLVQSVVAGVGVQDMALEPTEIDQPCPCCGAATSISYRDGVLFHACTGCEGPTPGKTGIDGFLSATKFEPAGMADRTPTEIRAASRIASIRQVETMFNGVCPTCSGRVDGWFDCCVDHDADDICGDCGTEFPAWARFECRVCKDHGNSSPKALALFDPAVVAFYENHGVSTRFHVDDFEGLRRGFELMDAHTMDLVADDPPHVDVTVECGSDELTITFDETVSVVDVTR